MANIAVYLPSGTDEGQARKDLVSKIARWVAAHPEKLVVLTGDLNFVLTDADRVDADGTFSGARDAGEAEHWLQAVEARTPLRELWQPEHTFHAKDCDSRLDRAYATHHAADYHQSTLYATRLPVAASTSDHDAISFGRRMTAADALYKTLSDAACRCPEWPLRVAREYHARRHDQLRAGEHPDALDDAETLKTAMHTITKLIVQEGWNRESDASSGLAPWAISSVTKSR